MAAALASALALPTDGGAQGVGSAGSPLLTLTAGTRAAALGGAYAAMGDDPDGVFHNPASVVWNAHGASFGLQEHVEDIVLGSLAGTWAGETWAAGLGVTYFDAGDIVEIEPDPDRGDGRGRPTGETVTAIESVARAVVALRLFGGRASAGAAVGLLSSDLAGARRQALFADLGVQARLGRGGVGASLRHLGTAVSGEAHHQAPLPVEARIGGTYLHPLGERVGVLATADAVVGVAEKTVGLAFGGEAGLLPGSGPVSATLRAGMTVEEGQHLGRLRLGGGLGVGGLFLDYTLQRFSWFGTIHRVGVRWVGTRGGG